MRDFEQEDRLAVAAIYLLTHRLPVEKRSRFIYTQQKITTLYLQKAQAFVDTQAFATQVLSVKDSAAANAVIEQIIDDHQQQQKTKARKTPSPPSFHCFSCCFSPSPPVALQPISTRLTPPPKQKKGIFTYFCGY